MQPTSTYDNEVLLSEITLAAHLLQPAKYAVSTNHLVVECPLCDPADNKDSVLYDYMFAVTGTFQSAQLHCDAHKLEYH